MASFIYTLSLFVLVLTNSYFTLPITDFSDQLGINGQVNLNVQASGSIDGQVGDGFSQSVNDQFVDQAVRTLNEFSTSEPMSFTTEQPSHGKRDSEPEDTSFATEQLNTDKREHDDLSFTTEQSSQDKRDSEPEDTSFATEQSSQDKRDSDLEDASFTTEQLNTDKRDHDDLSFTTVEPSSQLSELERRDFNDKSESETQKMPVEFVTDEMLSFSSTSSTNAPELYTSEPLISASTEKYIGHLQHESEHEGEYEQDKQTKHVPTRKSSKTSEHEEEYKQDKQTNYVPTRKSSKTSEHEEEYKQEKETNYVPKQKSSKTVKDETEDSKESKESTESNVRTALYDQDALKSVTPFPDNVMTLDENKDVTVPNKVSTASTKKNKNKNEEVTLNQDTESSHNKEEESNN